MFLKYNIFESYWCFIFILVTLYVSCNHDHCHVREVTFRSLYKKVFKLQLIFKNKCCLVNQYQAIDQLLYYSKSESELLDNPFRIALRQNENITKHLFLDPNSGNITSTFLEFTKISSNQYVACVKKNTHMHISDISWDNVTALSACGVSLEMIYYIISKATSVYYLYMCFSSYFYSKIINISNTNLQDLTICCAHLTRYVIHAPHLKTLSLYNTHIENIEFDQATRGHIENIEIHSTFLRSVNYIIHEMLAFPRLVTLNTSRSAFSHIETLYSKLELNYLEVLDLSHCTAEIFETFTIFSSLPKLKSINLSGNSIITYSPTLFKNMYLLKKIYLSNCFTVSANHSVDLKFNTLDKIEVLDLSSNRLNNLNIKSDKSIQHLYVSKNSLTTSEFVVECETTPCVGLLNLSYNKILVNRNMMKRIEQMKIIDIGHNVVPCSDCDFIRSEVYQKLKDNIINITLLDLNNNMIRCTSPDKQNNNYLFDININKLCPIDYTMTAAVITLAIIGVISVILAFLGYIYRREIYFVVVYIMAKIRQSGHSGKSNNIENSAKSNNIENNGESNSIEDKMYDAFISYSIDDCDWVKDELKPVLQNGPRKYKLCFNDRIGLNLCENIELVLKKSQSCVMILTNSYLESELCQWEQKMITNSQLEGYNISLILIIKGDLMSMKFPMDIHNYLLKKTYIEWNTEKYSEDILYQQLEKSLGQSIHQKSLQISTT